MEKSVIFVCVYVDFLKDILFALSKFLEANGSNAVSAGMSSPSSMPTCRDRYNPSERHGWHGSLPVIDCGTPDGKATAVESSRPFNWAHTLKRVKLICPVTDVVHLNRQLFWMTASNQDRLCCVSSTKFLVGIRREVEEIRTAQQRHSKVIKRTESSPPKEPSRWFYREAEILPFVVPRKDGNARYPVPIWNASIN